MTNNSQSVSNYGEDKLSKKIQIANNYGNESFSFFWLKFAGFGMMLYYIAEMVNRILFIALEDSPEQMWITWRIVDSSYLILMFVLMGLQVMSWRRNNIGVENKKKTNYAFFSVILAGVFVALYEILTMLRELLLNYSSQGDLTVPFMLMIMLHIFGFILVKNLITIIGRYKGVKTGGSIFYTLFAINPVVRYLLPFIFLILLQLTGGWASMFFIYSELVMTYISAVIAVGFFIFIWKDSRKIKIGHLLMNHEKEPRNNVLPQVKGIRYIETGNKIIEVPIKQDFSVFCPICGLIVYDNAKTCVSCGSKIT